MTTFQNFYSTVFNFGPAIYLFFAESWIIGIFAFLLGGVLSILSSWFITLNIDYQNTLKRLP